MRKIKLCLLCSLLIWSVQAQISKKVECKSGQLCKLLTQSEVQTVNELTLTGTIDARDFITMKKMPVLSVVDLKDVTINAYSGSEWRYADSTNANEIPAFAFFNASNGQGKESLVKIRLPRSVLTFGDYAFANCSKLKEIQIDSEIPPEFSLLAFDGVDIHNCKLHVSQRAVDAYKDKEGWNHFCIIEDL
ncbi:MAG: leucine-rich repeat protein [Bacteroidota bacterium]|nr:leucine-rich repeat protein [Bacteroidota bacterium]MDP4270749.1 leucine-rich repeat protein [Bacteroidota bacterium]